MSSLIKPVPGGFDLVQKLLSESHSKFHILYKVIFANHLPHALYTICCLGASLVRIQEYYDMYVKKLEPLEDPAFEINLSNAWNYMGNKKAYSEYLEFFDKQIQSRGVKECMSIFFPKLIGLSLGEAFHPLIHIGYGLEFDNPLILSEGFSYACTYPLVGSSILAEVEPRLNKEEWCSIDQLLTKLRGMDVPTIDPEVKNFHDKTEFVITELAEMRDMLESWDHSWSWDEPSLQSKKLNELTES